jgi:hypothetical protein
METAHRPLAILRKLLCLTILGFLVVLLAPVLIGILSVVGPFVLIGFVVWGGWQFLRHGVPGGWQRIRAFSAGVYHTGRTAAAVPARALGGVGRVALTAGSVLLVVARFFGRVLGAALVGAVIGGALGAVGGMHYHDAHVRIPIGVLVGGVIGAVASALRKAPAQQLTAIPVDERMA